MAKRLSTGLQVGHAQRMFTDRNPSLDTDLIDWHGVIDEDLTYSENLQALECEYPQFDWSSQDGEGPRAYEEMVIQQLRDEAEPYNFEIIKGYQLAKLEKASRRADVLEKENEVLRIENGKSGLVGVTATQAEGSGPAPRLVTAVSDPETQNYVTVVSRIIEDASQVLIVLNSETGHGKSSSLRTIIAELKVKKPRTIVKVFDISLVWYSRAPVKYRQRITEDMVFDYLEGKPSFQNIPDCVYEIKSLSKDMRRIFVGIIVKEDLDSRYNLGVKHGIEKVQELPDITYVFEEANRYFDSFSLRKDDVWGDALNDFVSMGRNYKMRGFLVITAEVGELSPGFRRRTTGRLLGRIINEYDLAQICKGQKGRKEMLRKTPQYHWTYRRGHFSSLFRIRDTVTNIPVDYVSPRKTLEQNRVVRPVPKPFPLWVKLVGALGLGFMIALIFL